MPGDDDRLEWVPLYASKLLGALSRMRPDEGHLYWIVCLRIYEVGAPCRDNLDALARLSGMTKRRVSDNLDRLFRAGKLVRETDGIMNPFAGHVLAEARAFREGRSRAGKEGASRRWEKSKEKQRTPDGKANAEAMANDAHLQIQDTLFPNGNRAPKVKPAKPKTALEVERKSLFDRGDEIFGPGAGGLIQNLLAVKHGNVALTRAAIEQASTMDNPRQYVGGIIRGGSNAANRNGNAGGRGGGFDTVVARIDTGRTPSGVSSPAGGDAADAAPRD